MQSCGGTGGGVSARIVWTCFMAWGSFLGGGGGLETQGPSKRLSTNEDLQTQGPSKYLVKVFKLRTFR